MQQKFEAEPKSLFDYWEVLKRRHFLFWVPILVISFVTVYLAFSPPSIYRSEATILIEDQEIPADIVGATITNYASQQIQLISQRLLTVKNIKSLVEKFDVYGPMEPSKAIAPTTWANWFRQDTEFALVSTDVFDSRGRSGEAAIAFTLAFNSVKPKIAQQVSEELVLLFLNENQRSSASRTTGVSEFLRAAVDDANVELLIAEAELAEFKASNEGALPELYLHNLNVISRTEDQLSGVNLRIQELQQRELQLSAQLAPLSPLAPVTLPSGETITSDRERLRALQADFRRKAAIYQPGHPDLITLEREIGILQKSVGDMGSRELLKEQLRQEQEKLDLLRDRYSKDHPDVRSADAAIAAIESQLASTESPGTVDGGVANNPAYVLINTQLQSTELELQSMLQKRSEIQNKIAEHEALVEQAPRVEMEYEGLSRSYENARTNYGDLQAKLRAADVAGDVGKEITGQRFTLLEPPALPLQPTGPDRLAIVVIGLILAFSVGSGCILIAELLDKSIRTVQRLSEISGRPPLVVIPYLNNSEDLAHAGTQRTYLIIALIAGSALFIVFVHNFIRPLNAFF